MTARYFIRLDDACPTMHRERWGAIEAMLDELGIQPLVAIVPDNRHPELMHSPAAPDFWERAKAWEERGWTIAMHGLHHLYHSVDRRRLILPLYDHSEFGGLPEPAQAALLRQSWALFEAHGIRPTVWIAPSHSFDGATVRALRSETPIRIISDGLSIDYFFEDGFVWLPQQLWKPEPRRRGLWTICLHPNGMDDTAIDDLRRILSQPYYRDRIVGLSDLALGKRRKNLADRAYRRYFLSRSRVRSMLVPAYRAGKRVAAIRRVL
jgi:predicted deacetylase